MKTFLALSLFCFFAMVQKVAAQTNTTDSTGATQPAKPPAPANYVQTMRQGRHGFWLQSVPFPGGPAHDARHNTRRFQIPKDLIAKVRSGEVPATSDYFKPTAASTPIPAMLADSSYVKDYRYYAYNIAIRQTRHPVGTGLIIGGSVIVFVIGMVGLIIALGHVHIHGTMY